MMSLKNQKSKTVNQVKKDLKRGQPIEDAVQRQREEQKNYTGEAATYQGEYHEEGQPVVRGNTVPEPGSPPPDTWAQGKGGSGPKGQNNLGQHNDHDDDYQSGSKGGNRSGKTGTRQGGSRGKGTK